MSTKQENLLIDIYKKLSKNQFIDTVQLLEEHRDEVDPLYRFGIYFHLNDQCGYSSDRDICFRDLLTGVGNIEEEAWYVIGHISSEVSRQNIHESVLTVGDAINYLETGLTKNKNHVKSFVLLSQIYWRLGNYTESLKYINKAIRQDKTAIKYKILFFNNIHYLTNTRDLKIVINDIESSRTQIGDFEFFYINGRISNLKKSYSEAISFFELAATCTGISPWRMSEINSELAKLYLKAKDKTCADKYLKNLTTDYQYKLLFDNSYYIDSLNIANEQLKTCDSHNKPEWIYRILETLYKLKKYSDANSKIKDLLDLKMYRHDRYNDFLLAGKIKLRCNKIESALELFEKAMIHIQESDGEIPHYREQNDMTIHYYIAFIHTKKHCKDQTTRFKKVYKKCQSINVDTVDDIKLIREELLSGYFYSESTSSNIVNREIKYILSHDLSYRRKLEALEKKISNGNDNIRKEAYELLYSKYSDAENKGLLNKGALSDLARLEGFFGRYDKSLEIWQTMSALSFSDKIVYLNHLWNSGDTVKAKDLLFELNNTKYLNNDEKADLFSEQINFIRDKIKGPDDTLYIDELNKILSDLIKNEVKRFSSLTDIGKGRKRISIKDLILYKYKAFNINTINSIQNNYLYFSKPSQLNDPFDIVIEEIHKSRPDLFEYYSVNPNDFGVFSTTPINNNKLMWAHYADEHRGICIGYRFNSLPEAIGWESIRYCPDYEQSDDLLKKGGYILNSLITKTEQWQYEEEIRFFSYQNNSQKISYYFDPAVNKLGCEISEIILGYKMAPESQVTVKSMVGQLNCLRRKEKRPEVKLYRTIRNHLFNLNLEEVK